MLSKQERFKSWRGAKAEKEKKYVQVVEFLSHYVESKSNLNDIQADAENPLSGLFKFQELQGRVLGGIAFFKLIADEARDSLAPEMVDSQLFQVLLELNSLLLLFYDHVFAGKAAANKLIDTIKQLLTLDDSEFANKEITKKLFLSLATVLNLVLIAIGSFNSLGYLVQAAISAIVNINEIEKEVRKLAEMLQQKEYLLQPDPVAAEENNSPDLSTILLGYFNQRYVDRVQQKRETISPLQGKGSVFFVKLAQLTGEMEMTSTEIARILILRKRREERKAITQTLEKFFGLIQKNESTGEKGFLDLIAEDSHAYNLVLDKINPEHKEQFIAKVEQLKNAVTESTVSLMAQSISWLSTSIATAYHTYTPQWSQDKLVLLLPATQNSECTALMKGLIRSLLNDWETQELAEQKELAAIGQRLFPTDENLKDSFMTAPSSTLAAVGEAIGRAKEAGVAYSHAFACLQRTQRDIYKCQYDTEILNNFILVHNTFWVKLSNFFAQFLSIFKTDAARMVDKAIECKRNIENLQQQYTQKMNETWGQINNNADISGELKSQLKKAHLEEIEAKPEILAIPFEKERDIRVLMNHWAAFFNSPKAQIDQDVPIIEAKCT